MRSFLLAIISLTLGLSATVVYAAMSSPNYRIDWDSVNTGGTEDATSPNYQLDDSVGQFVSGFSSSANYQIFGGYRVPMGEDLLSLDIHAEDSNVREAYSAFDYANRQVSVPVTTVIERDDYILLVENEGLSQKIAIGRVTSVGSTTNPYILTVDDWSGDAASMQADPNTPINYISRLSTNSISLGSLNSLMAKTGVSMFEITDTSRRGYALYVKEDHNLQSGVNDIDDVMDGEVTLASEEYGVEALGGDTAKTGDWAITDTMQKFASSTIPVYGARGALIHKAAVSQETVGGSYSHTIGFYCTVNY